MKKTLVNTSSKKPRPALTVLLRMAADQQRAARIKKAKKARPDLTWRRIADVVGVSERSVSGWSATGQLTYAHAKKLAAVLESDLDWLWKGPREEAPDLMALLNQTSRREQLDRIEQKLDLLEAHLLEQELGGADGQGPLQEPGSEEDDAESEGKP